MTPIEELRKVYEEVGTMSMYASTEARLDAALLAVARYSAQRQSEEFHKVTLQSAPLWMDEPTGSPGEPA